MGDFYGAWSDKAAEFGGSCNTCVEVACVNKDIVDRCGLQSFGLQASLHILPVKNTPMSDRITYCSYGAKLRRSSTCYDEKRTVVLKIVDAW